MPLASVQMRTSSLNHHYLSTPAPQLPTSPETTIEIEIEIEKIEREIASSSQSKIEIDILAKNPTSLLSHPLPLNAPHLFESQFIDRRQSSPAAEASSTHHRKRCHTDHQLSKSRTACHLTVRPWVHRALLAHRFLPLLSNPQTLPPHTLSSLSRTCLIVKPRTINPTRFPRQLFPPHLHPV